MFFSKTKLKVWCYNLYETITKPKHEMAVLHNKINVLSNYKFDYITMETDTDLLTFSKAVYFQFKLLLKCSNCIDSPPDIIPAK